MLEQAAPKNFDGEDSKNVLVMQENAFSETCVIFEELGAPNPELLTVYKFYTKIRYFKKKHRPQDEN